MAPEPLNSKANAWDLDCCQKDWHSRTLLRRTQNAAQKSTKIPPLHSATTQNSTLVCQDMPCPKALGLIHQRGLPMMYLMTSDTIQNFQVTKIISLSRSGQHLIYAYMTYDGSFKHLNFTCDVHTKDLGNVLLRLEPPPNGVALEPPGMEEWTKSTLSHSKYHQNGPLSQ